jgi:uncharacterized membrane-anchored protein
MTEPTEDMIRAGMEAYATENVRDTSVDGKVRRIIASALAAAPPAPVVECTYTNYRGETAIRRISPISARFGSTEWHPEPQWLLLAFDHDKQAEREFAFIGFVPPPAPTTEREEAKRLVEAIERTGAINVDRLVDFLRRIAGGA